MRGAFLFGASALRAGTEASMDLQVEDLLIDMHSDESPCTNAVGDLPFLALLELAAWLIRRN